MTARTLALVMAVVAGACAGDSNMRERIIVFAAASLTEAMDQLSSAFERRHPSSDIVVNLAGSNQLAFQIERGAHAHVFISANPHWMEYLVERDLVVSPIAVARNDLVIAAPPHNPGSVSSWRDLTREGLLVVMAAPEVPAGRYADSLLARLGRRGDAPRAYAADVMRNIVSQEESVKGVVAKLLLGEADAGFVYRSDITAASGLRIVSLPDGMGRTDNYLMALVDSDTTNLARTFAAFVLSGAGRQILNAWGFDPPVNHGS